MGGYQPSWDLLESFHIEEAQQEYEELATGFAPYSPCFFSWTCGL